MNKRYKNGFSMLFSYTTPYIAYVLVAAVMVVLAIIMNFLTPQVMRFITDSIIGNLPADMPQFILDAIENIGGIEMLRQNLIIVATVTVVFALLSGIFNFICRYSMAKASEGAVRDLREDLFDHIQKLPFSWHTKHQTGDIIQRCTSDIEVIRGFISMQLLEFFRITILIIIALTLMFQMNVKLTVIAIAFMPVVIAYSTIFFSRIRNKFKVADEAEGALSATVQENLTGVRVVRAFGREEFEIEKFKEKNNIFANFWINMGYVMGLYWGIGDVATGLQLMTITTIGVMEAVSGNITLGEFLVFISYNGMLVWPIRGFGRILSEMSKTGVSLQRVNEILLAEKEKETRPVQEIPMDGDIEFRNVNFKYAKGEHFSESDGDNKFEEKEVLNDVSFTVKSGTTVGILGGTGSGKSTLMYLLDRLYDLPDDCGDILINGVSIKNIKLSHLRKNIGFVLQEPFLFSKTIGENIAITADHYKDIEANMEEIRKCSTVAVVDDSIMSFGEGYNTIVGERGVTLSGGQKQRVSIARMLMQKTPIMIFDDSLSAVDAETDTKIRHAINENTGTATIIIISHRITTIMNADKIVVLDDGKVSQIGNHDELKKVDGIYKTIFDIQGNLEAELQNAVE